MEECRRKDSGRPMTPAISDGYEIASERREGLKRWQDGEWFTILHPTAPSAPLWDGEVYIAPIRLRLGENYRCRNGQETGDLARNIGSFKETHKFWSALTEQSFADGGNVMINPAVKSDWDIVAHIPKEKKMEISIKNRTVTRDTDGFSSVTIPTSEAARIYLEYPEVQAEVERQKREKEIKLGDYVFNHKYAHVFIVASIESDGFYGPKNQDGSRHLGTLESLVKITWEEYETLKRIKSRVQ